MKNTTNIKVPKKYQTMLQEVFKDNDGSYWAYAKTGYYFHDMDYGVHSAVEDNQKTLLEKIRSLKKCDCEQCE